MLPELDRMKHEATELNRLVQQLLLLARLESGNELAREVGSYPIAELIYEVTENAAFEARQIGRSIVIARAQSFTVKGYRDLLKSALDNVIRNALRFTKEGSEVQLDFFRSSDPNRGVIQVRDQGPGVG
jgi:two-component system sensor histidine kinase CpxA